MGMHHLVSISNDFLERYENDREDVEKELGGAIFTLCIDPQHGYLGKPKLERIEWADIKGSGAAVRHVSELHSSDYEAFVFCNGSTKSVRDLKAEELEKLIEYILGLQASKQ